MHRFTQIGRQNTKTPYTAIPLYRYSQQPATSKPINQFSNNQQPVNQFPYGEILQQSLSLTPQENKYLFQGKERDWDTGLDYVEARYFDPAIGMFRQVDPLWEKYPGWSPYNYTANDPINKYDPDGRVILFGKGVSKEFKEQFAAAVKYLNKHKVSGKLAVLQKSDKIFYITKGDRSLFNPKTNTIYWNPFGGLETTNGNKLSPAILLIHEVDHANQKDKNPKKFRNDLNTTDSNYDNKEEKRVIMGSETEAAQKTGEIQEGTQSRYDHLGRQYPTKGPTTTEFDPNKAGVSWDDTSIDPIIVTPEKKEKK
jgi:RHS repeat-associated protein